MNIKAKYEMNEEQTTPIDNKLELLKFTSEVQSAIKRKISSDFVLAKLKDQDKEGIVELTGDAYFSQRVIEIIKNKGKHWEWNKTAKTWRQTPLTPEEEKLIEEIGKTTFNAYMTRIYMTVILNRNVDKNYLVNLLAQQQINDEPEEPTTLKEKTKKKLENEETQE